MPLSRRSLLTALGTVLLTAPAGCTLFDGDSPPPRAGLNPPLPDPLLPVLAGEAALLVLYDATLERYPHLVARLGSVRADHAAHLDALRAIVRLPAPSPSSSTSAKPASGPPGAATAAAALAALRAAEGAGGRRLTAACLSAPSGQAALLGSIAACESSHLVIL